jgi:1-deoxy-D-xylulose-5-phosphate synthase
MLDTIKEPGGLRRRDVADLKQIALPDVFSDHDSPAALYAKAPLGSARSVSEVFSIPGNDVRTCTVGHG